MVPSVSLNARAHRHRSVHLGRYGRVRAARAAGGDLEPSGDVHAWPTLAQASLAHLHRDRPGTHTFLAQGTVWRARCLQVDRDRGGSVGISTVGHLETAR